MFAHSLFREYAQLSCFPKNPPLHRSFSPNKLPITTDTFPFPKPFVEVPFLLNVLPFLFGFVPCRYMYKTQFCITHSRTCFFSNPEHSKQCFFIAFNGVTFILFPLLLKFYKLGRMDANSLTFLPQLKTARFCVQASIYSLALILRERVGVRVHNYNCPLCTRFIFHNVQSLNPRKHFEPMS